MSGNDNQSVKSFFDMTEEEKLEWARNYVVKPRKPKLPGPLAQIKKPKVAKIVRQRIEKKREYRDPEKRKRIWGDEYVAKMKFLYNHNEEYREKINQGLKYRRATKRAGRKDSWTQKYYSHYRNNLDDLAQTFRLTNSQLYLKGFTLKELCKYTPGSYNLFCKYMEEGLFPAPEYEGHLYHKEKFNDKTDKFFLVREVQVMLYIFVRYRRNYLAVRNERQKLYLKKRLWSNMKKIREEFNER